MVGPGPIWGVRGGIPKISPGHPVLSLPVGGQIPRLKFHVAIRAADLLVYSLPVGVSLSSHLEAVGICRVTPKCVERMTIHAYHIIHIGEVAYVVKVFRQGVKGPLKACHPS